MASPCRVVGGNVGWARIGADCDGASSCDKTSTGYKGYLGYRWPNHFAVEALYVDWGKATAQATDEYVPPDIEQPTALRPSALDTVPIYDTIDYQLRATSWGGWQRPTSCRSRTS